MKKQAGGAARALGIVIAVLGITVSVGLGIYLLQAASEIKNLYRSSYYYASSSYFTSADGLYISAATVMVMGSLTSLVIGIWLYTLGEIAKLNSITNEKLEELVRTGAGAARTEGRTERMESGGAGTCPSCGAVQPVGGSGKFCCRCGRLLK